ncbi:MAG TPA: class I SAM-dependent methyltransferase [Rhodanobacteraceae bacterium]|jgi:trans-aconitate methyltransferase
MSVASHLGIQLDEYDARIRTFIPDYEAMLEAGAAIVPRNARTIVDLGIGTGAFAARCARRATGARVVGIDADRAILAVAARRLGARLTPTAGSFLRTPLPACDVVVTSFALHHVRTRAAKAALYRRIRSALRARGRLIIVDCAPALDRALRSAQRSAWLAHLRRAYSPAKARGLLAAWSREDTYVPLEIELNLLRRGGLRPDVLWRRGAFAVIVSAPA